MNSRFFRFLSVVAPVAGGLALSSIPASASEVIGVEDGARSQVAGDRSTTSVSDIIASPTGSSDTMGQVTSVSQLSDVQPTDWAFQALQSLVERYGCIAGYPDGTYRGNRAMTRYEFAAGLNACLDRVNELIAAGLADKVSQEDLAVLQRLQEEFAAELATLRGRVDALEARVAEVEANLFSTTTKLEGEVLFLVSATNDNDDLINAAGNDVSDADQVVFIDRVRLDFITSFTGEDELETSVEAGNIENSEGNPFPSNPLGFNAGGDEGNNFELDDLIYTFPLGPAEVLIGATGLDIDDPVDDITPLSSSGSGTISEFGDAALYEQAFPGSGAGIGFSVPVFDQDSFSIALEGGYVADNPADPSGGDDGLFNGDYGAIGQITFNSDFLDIGLGYVNSYTADADFPRLEDVYELDNLPGGEQFVANTYGGQLNFKLFDGVLEIGGGAAFSQINGIGSIPDFEVWSYQGTLAVNDLLVEGSKFGFVAGVPSYTRDLADEGRSDDTGFLLEGFYNYPINDFITITPSIIYINDPFNVNDNDDVVIGTLRTNFEF
ncbi:MAG: iron uptake porin [Elainellaceae cyanobacterium]